MKTATKQKQQHKKEVELRVIVNKGTVVNNSKLPVSCRYCELKWEQQTF